MAVFVAHYSSPAASVARAKGVFEFESEARIGSKANLHDARMTMLEEFGKDAVSWTIDKVERKKARSDVQDGQMELDFRDDPTTRRRRKTVERGRL